nr:hypothetical protein [Candidatus Sigynarchaeota archaeon]
MTQSKIALQITKIGNFLKHNPLFAVMLVVFFAWTGFLLISGAFFTRSPTFYDALNQVDVTSQYSSSLPLERYLLEPFVAFTFTVGATFPSALIVFAIMYIGTRIISVWMEKHPLKDNKKAEIVLEHARNSINFFTRYAGVILCILVSIMGIGSLVYGFLFTNNTFMGLILISAWMCCIMFAVKVGYNLVTLLHPKLRFRITHALPRHTKPQKRSNVAWREVHYGSTIFVAFVLVGFACISIPLPNQHFNASLGADEYLFDFHAHTFYSDGSISPEARVDWYISQGIQGAAFTDHENQRGYEIARDYVERNHLNFTVIQAQEYTRQDIDIHMNIFGLSQVYAPEDEANPSVPYIKFMNVSQVIQDVKNNSGFITVNHYGGEWAEQPYTLEALQGWGVDGFEIMNENLYQGDTIRNFCIDHHLACMGGSDIHFGYDMFCFVKLKVANPANLAQIFTELKKNEHQVVVVSYLNEVVPFPGYALSAFNVVANYFFSIDAGQRASWLVWSCIAFACAAAFLFRIKSMDLAAMERAIIVKQGKAFDLFKMKPRKK